MVSYYSAMILLCWLALGVLCILVHENSWIPKEDKRRFYLTYGIIALSALTKWIGIQLNGNETIPAWLLSLVKCADYILTPMAGGAVVAQMKLRNRWYKVIMYVLIANAVFQIIAFFNQWMVVIDEHNYYTHGPLYAVYVTVYLFILVLTAAEFLVFGLAYRKQNRTSLLSIFLLVIVGIVIQEALGSEFRTAYIALTIGVALMFIHYAEFYKMTADENIKKQRNQLMKDALSGVYSRHAYMKALEKYKTSTTMKDDVTAFTIDINGLKVVNDTAGHDAGDELIIGAARCIENVIGNKGRCYRTGGDEFIILGHMKKEQSDNILLRLEKETERWSKDKENPLSLAAGYAREEDYQGFTIEELIKKADRAMYAAKTEYYRKNGKDPRYLR